LGLNLLPSASARPSRPAFTLGWPKDLILWRLLRPKSWSESESLPEDKHPENNNSHFISRMYLALVAKEFIVFYTSNLSSIQQSFIYSLKGMLLIKANCLKCNANIITSMLLYWWLRLELQLRIHKCVVFCNKGGWISLASIIWYVRSQHPAALPHCLNDFLEQRFTRRRLQERVLVITTGTWHSSSETQVKQIAFSPLLYMSSSCAITYIVGWMQDAMTLQLLSQLVDDDVQNFSPGTDHTWPIRDILSQVVTRS